MGGSVELGTGVCPAISLFAKFICSFKKKKTPLLISFAIVTLLLQVIQKVIGVCDIKLLLNVSLHETPVLPIICKIHFAKCKKKAEMSEKQILIQSYTLSTDKVFLKLQASVSMCIFMFHLSSHK